MRPDPRATGLGCVTSTRCEAAREPVVSDALGTTGAGRGSAEVYGSVGRGASVMSLGRGVPSRSIQCGPRLSIRALELDRVPNIGSSWALNGRVEATRIVIIRLNATTAIRNANKIVIEPTSHKIATTMHDPCQAR